MRYIALSLCFLLLGLNFTFAQEELFLPLKYNPKIKSNTESFSYRNSDFDTLDLDQNAFWDDFSQEGSFPKKEFWIDKFVFINSSLAYKPMSYNIATFDGLNELGIPYNPGITNSKGNIADKLTSVPIDLSKYTKADSIYLSFFYQAQGLGDAPESFDSLVLEIKPSRYWNGYIWDSTAWFRIWSAEGSTLHPFKQVIINIPQFLIDTSQNVDTIAHLYHQAFQFRFMNYGNLSGNMDHWHLDYVYLNKGRTINDIYFKDMTITRKPLSLLKDYRSMPWSHFDRDVNFLRPTLKIHARNMSNQPLNLIGRCSIVDTIDNEYLLFSSDDKTIYNSDTMLTLAFNIHDSLQLGKVQNADTVALRINVSSRIIDDFKANDQTTLFQEFVNHYSYDDGIPEMGYSIYPGNFSQLAYKFKAGKIPNEDSLRGVHIYFNLSDDNVSFMAFKILIWNKGDYKTEPVVIETRIPEIDPDYGNGYYFFPFDTILSIKNDFYIGWEQNTEFKINVGLDMNYFELLEDTFPVRANTNIFYKTFGDWKTSSAKGALMMRPVFSSKAIETASINNQPEYEKGVLLYPNPAQDQIYIMGIQYAELTFYNSSGQSVLISKAKNEEKIDISALSDGFYFIRICDLKNNKLFYKKLIVK